MQKIIKFIVYLCLALVPFLAYYIADGSSTDFLNWGTSGMFFPFISGKNIVFRILVEIAFFGWFLLALLEPKYRPKKSGILIAYTLFIIAIFIADVFGVDAWRSFWSNFERMEGFVGHIHLFAYFVVLTSVLTTKDDWKKMFHIFVASDLLVMSYGFLQLFGSKDFIVGKLMPILSSWIGTRFPIHMSSTRLDSTIGNSAYYGIYCLFFTCIAAILWTQATSKNEKRWWTALGALNLISLFYTGTRGTVIGLVGAVIVSFGIIAWEEKGRSRKILIGGLVTMTALIVLLFAMKDTAIVRDSPSLARFSSISPKDVTTMSRFTIWKISYDAWKERPLFGYGQENFSSIFAERFIPDRMWNLEPWYDRSHDVFFDWLVAGGLVGLLTYLSLFGVALYLMWWKKSTHGEAFPMRERALITGLLAGYFLHNIFVFDNLTSYILFIFILGYILSKTYEGQVYGGHTKVGEDAVTWLWAPLVGVLFLVVFYMVSYKVLLTNRLLISGMDINRQMSSGMSFPQIVKNQETSFTEAINLHVAGSEESREQFLQTAAKMAQIQIPPDFTASQKQAIAQAINDLIISARQEIDRSYPDYKQDVRALSIFGMFYNIIGDSVSAQKVLEEALVISPYKQITAFDLVRAYLTQKKYPEAHALAKKEFLSAPLFDNALKLYVICAIYDGHFDEIQGVLTSVNRQLPIDGDTINALVDTKQFDKAIEILNALKQNQPTSTGQVDAYIKQILAKKAVN